MDVSCADNALAARIAECPGVADKQAAAHRRGDLVSAAKAAGLDGELDALLAARPAVSELLDGVFSASPFLADLMRQDPGRLLRCLREAPENRLAALIGDLRAVSAGAVSTEEAMTALRRFRQELALLVGFADDHVLGHGRIGLDRADAVDAADRGDDDHVVAFQQGPRGAVAHAVDGLVDLRFLFDIGIAARHIGLGLVVIVIADEIFHRIFGKEALEFPV